MMWIIAKVIHVSPLFTALHNFNGVGAQTMENIIKLRSFATSR